MEINNYKLAVIIVTYNRKELLLQCINSILTQTIKPTTIYIIDNASTDGTKDFLIRNNILSNKIIDIQYYRMPENEGGAGGFYYGLKTAHESNKYDAYVVMDDDGIADEKELEELIKYSDQYSYINALVVNKDDKTRTAFGRKNHGYNRESIEKEANENGIIFDYASPFNGTLYTKDLINKVGYPNPKLFFQGDEINFHKRALKAGYIPITNIKSIHYHPFKSIRRYEFNFILKKIRLVIEDTPIRIYCRHRNIVYNRFNFKDYVYIFITYFLFSYLYLFKSKSYEKYKIFNQAVWDGLCKNLSKHKKYLNLNIH